MTKKWIGSPPTNCDLCQCKLKDSFYDAKTTMGPWGNMCKKCFKTYDIGLGIGKGQVYNL